MALDLLQAARSLVGGSFTQEAARHLGESETNTSQALSALIPAFLTALIARSNQGDTADLVRIARNAYHAGWHDPQPLVSENPGVRIEEGMNQVHELLGHHQENLLPALSSFAGTSSYSTQSLLAMVGSLILGWLGKKTEEEKWSEETVHHQLKDEKDAVLAAIPLSLKETLTRAFGIYPSPPPEPVVHEPAGNSGGYESGDGTGKWLMYLFFGIMAVLLIYYFSKGCDHSPSGTMDRHSVHPDSLREMPEAIREETRPSIMVSLPDGTSLTAFRGGIEDKMVAFLNSDWQSLPQDSLKKIWFDFDNINFVYNSDSLTPQSIPQIRNVAAIINAYPEARFKIGGYTDKVGSDTFNLALSERRADHVSIMLKDNGASAGRIVGAEGYGEAFAKAAEDAPDAERVKDRRMSVSVRKPETP